MKKKFVLPLVVLALIMAAGLWYTRPRTFWEITNVSEETVRSAAFILAEGRVEHGTAWHDVWELQDLSPGDPDFDAILTCLGKTRWRASLKNLLGQDAGSLSGFISCLQGVLALPQDEGIFFTAVSTGKLRLSLPSAQNSLLFTAADPVLYGQLADYLMEHGTFQAQESP